jgi:hypothetical protein
MLYIFAVPIAVAMAKTIVAVHHASKIDDLLHQRIRANRVKERADALLAKAKEAAERQ